MPWTSGSALRASIVARSFASVDVGGQAEQRPAHPGGLAGVLLVPDVDLAGRVLADQDDRQAGDPARSRPGGAATSRGDLVPDRLGERLAVEDAGGQRTILPGVESEAGVARPPGRTTIMAVVSGCLQASRPRPLRESDGI